MKLLLLFLVAEAPATAAPDASHGQRLFLQCQACHGLAADSIGKIGPGLAGVSGRRAATQPGYTYSTALKASTIVWTDAALDRWLVQPAAMVPETKMVFGGIADAGERADLIAFLKKRR